MTYNAQSVCIVGGTGSLGNELIKVFIEKKCNHIHVISRDETKQWMMKSKYNNVSAIKYHIGDIRCKERMNCLIDEIQPTLIINASAMKHIDICEENVTECIQTNVNGVINITNACRLIKHQFVFVQVSTDKSVSPTTLYGSSKMIAERIVIDISKKTTNGIFLVVRYGNVLNSRGSIIPKYLEISKQQNTKSVFPLTNHEMTRFFMTLSQSVNLILFAIEFGNSGEIWLPCVKSFKIHDLALLFSKTYDKPIKKIDMRIGEKIHEILINEVEVPFVKTYLDKNTKEKMYIICPLIKNINLSPVYNKNIFNYINENSIELETSNYFVQTTYSSENTNDVKELEILLQRFMN